MKIKQDWWLANSLLYLISGLLFIITRANMGMLLGGLIVGGLNMLIGVALLLRNKIIFWVVFIFSSYGLLQELFRLITSYKQSGNFAFSISTLFVLVSFVFAIMLWKYLGKNTK